MTFSTSYQHVNEQEIEDTQHLRSIVITLVTSVLVLHIRDTNSNISVDLFMPYSCMVVCKFRIKQTRRSSVKLVTLILVVPTEPYKLSSLGSDYYHQPMHYNCI